MCLLCFILHRRVSLSSDTGRPPRHSLFYGGRPLGFLTVINQPRSTVHIDHYKDERPRPYTFFSSIQAQALAN